MAGSSSFSLFIVAALVLWVGLDTRVYAVASVGSAVTAVKACAKEAKKVSQFVGDLNSKSGKASVGLDDCVELLKDTVDDLNGVLSQLANISKANFKSGIANVKTKMSAALTNYDTCAEGLKETKGPEADVKARSENLGKLMSNALGVVNQVAHQGQP